MVHRLDHHARRGEGSEEGREGETAAAEAAGGGGRESGGGWKLHRCVALHCCADKRRWRKAGREEDAMAMAMATAHGEGGGTDQLIVAAAAALGV